MSNHEQLPTPPIESIHGKYVDIQIVDPTHMRSFLDNSRGGKGLYFGDEEDLPDPLVGASLDFLKNPSQDIGMVARIDFDSSILDEATETQWQLAVNQVMQDHLVEENYEIYELPHQAHAFYVQIDPCYVAHIRMDAGTHKCGVIINIEPINDLEHAIGYNLDTDPQAETDIYELLKRFSYLWTVAMDTVVDIFGDDDAAAHKKNSCITICAPNVTKSVVIYKQEVPSGDMPGIEQSASSDESFDTVGGLTIAKERLREIAIGFKHPEISKAYGVSGRHFMLYGPAGTGKSSLVTAFAREIDAELCLIDSSQVMDMYVGNSGANLSDVFDEHRTMSLKHPVVLFFDEFNAIAGKGYGSKSHTEVVELFKNHISQIAGDSYPNLFVAAATNSNVSDIDDAIVRSGRLEPIYAPVPNDDERVDVWMTAYLNSLRNFQNGQYFSDAVDRSFIPYDSDIDPHELASLTEGMTGADFTLILERARKLHMLHAHKTGEYRRVSQADIINQIRLFGR